MSKVFLGGTVTGINPNYGWRGQLIKQLKMSYFNPVVKNWNKKAKEEEFRQKNEICDFELFVITPEMRGYMSIAEAAVSSVKKKHKCIFCILNETFENDKKFTSFQLKSLNNVAEVITNNGGVCFTKLKDVIEYLNSYVELDIKFEIGKYYQHTSGKKIHILCEQATTFFGKALLAEDNKGEFLAVGKDKEHAINWKEIQKVNFYER